MADLARRVRALREEHGWSQSELARRVGCRQQLINNLEAGNQRTSKVLPRLAGVFGVDAAWLAHGQGSRRSQEVTLEPSAMRRLPVLSMVQAGRMTEIVDLRWIDEAESFEIVGDGGDLTEQSFVLTIVGDSMLPEFRPGERVVVTPGLDVNPGDYVVATTDDELEATLKKYRPRGKGRDGLPVIELAPLNDDYPKIILDAENPGHIVGRVVRHIRTF